MSNLEKAIQFAKNKQQDLQKRVSLSDNLVPDRFKLNELCRYWLPSDLVMCRSKADCEVAGIHVRRCDSDYWIKHASKVGKLMEEFCPLLGIDSDVGFATGFLYDLDYLKYPHDLNPLDYLEAHPFPLIKNLEELEVSPVIILAILEHSPHLKIEMTCPLSSALSACGDIVTYTAASHEISWPDFILEDWKTIFSRVEKGGLVDPTIKIDRFYQRVFPALQSLALV